MPAKRSTNAAKGRASGKKPARGQAKPAAGALLHNATTIGVCLNAMQPTLAPEGHRTFADRMSDIAENLHGTLEHIRGDSAAASPVAAAS